jgi:hypothetical protein
MYQINIIRILVGKPKQAVEFHSSILPQNQGKQLLQPQEQQNSQESMGVLAQAIIEPLLCGG